MKKLSAVVMAAALVGAPVAASAATAQADVSRAPVTKPLVLGAKSAKKYDTQGAKPKCTETRTTDCAVQSGNGSWVWVSLAGVVTGVVVALSTSDSP